MFLFAYTTIGYELCLWNTYLKLRMNAEHRKLKIDPEELWRDLLDGMVHVNSNKLVKRFNVIPEIEGFRAADNKAYHVEGRWNYWLRRIGRIVVGYGSSLGERLPAAKKRFSGRARTVADEFRSADFSLLTCRSL